MNTSADFGQLYQKHYPLVYRTALRHGVPARHAEDLTQQVFVKALPAYDSARSPLPYLLTITRNEVCNFHKQNREEPFLLPLVLLDEKATAEELIRFHQRWRLLMQLIDRLEPERRMVFELAEIEQFSQAEIAELLGIPVTTVESRLRDARRELHAAVERLRASDELPAFIVAGQALRSIEVPKHAQARVWQRVRLRMVRRRASRAVRTCAAVVLPGLLPLPAGAMWAEASPSVPEAVLVAAQPFAPLPGPEALPSVEPPAEPSPSVELASIRQGAPVEAPRATERAARKPPRTKEAPLPEDPAQAELVLMQGARHAWRAGNVKLALQECERHKRLYPNGYLSKLRDSLLGRIRQKTTSK